MKFFDVRHPFFNPLWRRVLCVAILLGWAAMEFSGGSPFWGILFAAAGIYCASQFFLGYQPVEPEEEDPK
jgi:hypothetical protein